MLGCRLVRISHERSDDRRCTGFVCREKSGLDQVGFEREYGGQLRVRQLSRVATVSRIEISPPAVILPRKQPAADTQTYIRSTFEGSSTTVWRHRPPPPGCH